MGTCWTGVGTQQRGSRGRFYRQLSCDVDFLLMSTSSEPSPAYLFPLACRTQYGEFGHQEPSRQDVGDHSCRCEIQPISGPWRGVTTAHICPYIKWQPQLSCMTTSQLGPTYQQLHHVKLSIELPSCNTRSCCLTRGSGCSILCNAQHPFNQLHHQHLVDNASCFSFANPGLPPQQLQLLKSPTVKPTD